MICDRCLRRTYNSTSEDRTSSETTVSNTPNLEKLKMKKEKYENGMQIWGFNMQYNEVIQVVIRQSDWLRAIHLLEETDQLID